MVERLPFKEKVGGPIPPGLTESNSALVVLRDRLADKQRQSRHGRLLR